MSSSPRYILSYRENDPPRELPPELPTPDSDSEFNIYIIYIILLYIIHDHRDDY